MRGGKAKIKNYSGILKDKLTRRYFDILPF